MKKGFLFDVDGSIAPYKGQEILPGVREKLAEIQGADPDVLLLFATNQAGSGWRELLGQEKYPRAQAVAERLLWISNEIGTLSRPWYVSIWDDRFLTLGKPEEEVFETLYLIKDAMEAVFNFHPQVRVFVEPTHRKPLSGMYWRAFCDARLLSRASMTVVGDRVEDRTPAEQAGFPFVWADDFFGRR